MTRKAVLFVCTQMEAAGVQVRATGMAEEALKRGIDAHVVFLYKKRAVFSGKPFVSSLCDGKPNAFQLLIILFKLLVLMRKMRPGAVIGMAHYSSPISAFLAALAGVKVRIGTQTNPPNTVPWWGRALDVAAGLTGAYTSNICASSAVFDCFGSYPKRYKRTLKIIFNGVKLDQSRLTKEQAREKFGLPAEAILVLSVGRLSAQKNHRFMIDVIARIPSSIYVILGDGELRSDLESDIRARELDHRVRIIKETPPEYVRDFLRAGDIFVFPSLFEAFGLALVEAMAAGLPVVCSTHPALREVVAGAGLAITLSDTDAWVSAISKLAGDPLAREKIGEACRDRAHNYAFESMFGAFMAEAKV